MTNIKKTIELNIKQEYIYDISLEDKENDTYNIIIAPKDFFLKTKCVPDCNAEYEEDFIILLEHHGFHLIGDSTLTYKDIATINSMLAISNRETLNEYTIKKYKQLKQKQIKEAENILVKLGLEKMTIV